MVVDYEIIWLNWPAIGRLSTSILAYTDDLMILNLMRRYSNAIMLCSVLFVHCVVLEPFG